MTQRLPLRPDLPPDDATVVLRAGVMSVDNDHPHFTLVLADLSELTLARLDRCFDAPIPNPGRQPQG